MKVTLFLLPLIFVYQGAVAARSITPMKKELCLNDQGKSRSGSHCVCYTGKTSCKNGEGTCAEQRCEEWTCNDDKDCAQISAKCVEKFCKI